MNIVLQTNELTKTFGKIHAVRQLDLSISAGQVFGILGPNGSGKTTTLGMVLGVTRPTSGSFSWFGQGNADHLRKRIGAILEHPIFYSYLSAVDNLKITAHIKDIHKPDFDGLLKMVGLYDRRNYAYKTYSLGMKQRLAIAAALVSDPEVLIFDEPTNGLDPQGIADIRKLIIEIAGMGKTIVLASHLLDEVQKVCSHFAVLRNGKKIYQGSVEDTLNQKQRIEVDAKDRETLRTALDAYHALKNVEESPAGYMLELDGEAETGELNRYLFDRGVVVTHLRQLRTNLEEQFLAILAENDS